MPFKAVLQETHAWLKQGAGKCEALREPYAAAEARKGTRARLSSSVAGMERRAEWEGDKFPLAQPLKYRWDKVSALLRDLRSAR